MKRADLSARLKLKGKYTVMEEKSIRFSEDGGILTAHLSGEIDHHSAKYERELIDSWIFKLKPKTLVLDFSGVRFMDSSGIGLIIGRAELCASLGAVLHLCGLNKTLGKLIRLSGVEKIHNISIV